jgi:hypothetical protein
MRIDDLLRASAHDVAHSVTPPVADLARIRQRVRRQRQRRGAAIVTGLAAAAAVAVIVSPRLDSQSAPAPTPEPADQTTSRYEDEAPSVLDCCTPSDQPLRPGGEYLVDAMLAETDAAVGFVVPGDDWVHFGAWTHKGHDLRSTAEVLIADVEAVPRDHCDMSRGWRDGPGRSPLQLGNALAGLEELTVLQQPTQGQHLGYPAVHLRLQGPPKAELSDCKDGHIVLWGGGEDVNMVSGQRFSGQIHDLWLLGVGGEILAIEQTWFPETPASTVTELGELAGSLFIDARDG